MNDPLNLRDYIIEFTSFIKNNIKDADPQNALSFFSMLLDAISPRAFLPCHEAKQADLVYSAEDYRRITREFQKLLSGNVSLERLQPFSQRLLSGALDNQLLCLFSDIAGNVVAVDQKGTFFHSLLQKATPRYFSRKEIEDFSHLCSAGNYSDFMLRLFKHGFQTIQNIPAFYGQRIYEQALTIDYDSPVRFYLMKEAADNGVEPACIEYANYLAKRKNYSAPLSEAERHAFAIALRYFLKASNYPPALWNIAFLLENNYVLPESYKLISQSIRIDTRLASNEFASHIDELHAILPADDCNDPDGILLAYKIHFYLAYRDEPFHKSFNSMAVLLSKGKLVVEKHSCYFAEDLVKKYRGMAVTAGDLFAILNESNELVKKICRNPEPADYDIQYVLELLKNGMDAGFASSIYNMALLHEHLNRIGSKNAKGIAEIVSLYQTAIKSGDKKATGNAHYRLGKIIDDEIEQEQHFSSALRSGNSDAAYDLALLWYRKYMLNKNNVHLLLDALDILDRNDAYMSSNKSETALLKKSICAARDEAIRNV